MAMSKPRYFLFLSICVLALGCFLFVGRSSIQQDEWPGYLGLTCLLVAICVAALIEGMQAQHRRIVELERKLAAGQRSGGPGT
jgi:hypothetical protein